MNRMSQQMEKCEKCGLEVAKGTLELSPGGLMVCMTCLDSGDEEDE